MVNITIDSLACQVHLCLYKELIPNDFYISPFLLCCQVKINVNFHTAITNLLWRPKAWYKSDIRKRKKEKKKRAAAFVLLGTEKNQARPVKDKGRGEPGDKEQMESDEGTEKQICEKHNRDEGYVKLA